MWLPFCCLRYQSFNTLRLSQKSEHFADNIFKCIFLKEKTRISINISLYFVPKCQINYIAALVQVIAWLPLGYPLPDKPIPLQSFWRGIFFLKWGRIPAESIQEPMLGLASLHLHGSLLPATTPKFPAGLLQSKCSAHFASSSSAQISVMRPGDKPLSESIMVS